MAKRHRIAAAIEVEIPADVDIFSLVVRSLTLAEGDRTIPCEPVGDGAYLSESPPEARIVRTELHSDPDAIFSDDE